MVKIPQDCIRNIFFLYIGGCVRSLWNLLNTTKAWIFDQKSTLIYKKLWLFQLNHTPSFTKTLTLDKSTPNPEVKFLAIFFMFFC